MGETDKTVSRIEAKIDAAKADNGLVREIKTAKWWALGIGALYIVAIFWFSLA